MLTGVTWLDTLLVIVMLIGAGAGAWSFARNRQTYYDIGKDMLVTAWPYLVSYMRPMKDEDQKKLDKSRRLPGEWDNFNKRPRDK